MYSHLENGNRPAGLGNCYLLGGRENRMENGEKVNIEYQLPGRNGGKWGTEDGKLWWIWGYGKEEKMMMEWSGSIYFFCKKLDVKILH